jgi:hypothetical protein
MLIQTIFTIYIWGTHPWSYAVYFLNILYIITSSLFLAEWLNWSVSGEQILIIKSELE